MLEISQLSCLSVWLASEDGKVACGRVELCQGAGGAGCTGGRGGVPRAPALVGPQPGLAQLERSQAGIPGNRKFSECLCILSFLP